jgi:hypothetical protein
MLGKSSSTTEADLDEKSLIERGERGYSDETFRAVMGEFQRQALFFWFVTDETRVNFDQQENQPLMTNLTPIQEISFNKHTDF